MNTLSETELAKITRGVDTLEAYSTGYDNPARVRAKNVQQYVHELIAAYRELVKENRRQMKNSVFDNSHAIKLEADLSRLRHRYLMVEQQRDEYIKDKERLDWREKKWMVEIDCNNTHTIPLALADGTIARVGERFWRIRFGQKAASNRFRTFRQTIDKADEIIAERKQLGKEEV